MAKKNSNEAYVYWFYNKYTFETYIGSRAGYAGSYKDDFLKVYKSSSSNEDFLNAMKNGKLVGEVIAVFTDICYEEAAFKAWLYEQKLIYLFWKELGQENSYNQACWYGYHYRINPFYRKYKTGEEHPRYIHLPIDEIIEMNNDGKTLFEIAEHFGVKDYIIRDRLKSLGIKWHNKEIIHVYDTIPMDEVLKLHRKGLTPHKMEQILNIDCRYIRKRLKDMGITPNKPNRFGKDAPGYGHHHPMTKGKDSYRYKKACPLVCWTQYHLLDKKVEELAKLFNISDNTMFARLKELGLNKSNGNNGSKNGRYVSIPYEILYELRINQKLTHQQIAEQLNVGKGVVCKRLREYSIENLSR